jgi:hypothetical protein
MEAVIVRRPSLRHSADDVVHEVALRRFDAP